MLGTFIVFAVTLVLAGLLVALICVMESRAPSGNAIQPLNGWEPLGPDQFHRQADQVNPATGLMMVGNSGVDMEGNPYGMKMFDFE
ncbi:hypothetical protein [Burkholderia sp. MBR-1]|uniref:hypothetical protein n=1 Tax=Burkholderia sp. MBR-1 TaxID=2732364 RepID=UPI0015EF578F|nr:hypothetical protein [Burkholderia sp. MBR-1]QMI49756.1 hypothetical protein MBR110_30240 [Burkholderia sp. MBR-1]